MGRFFLYILLFSSLAVCFNTIKQTENNIKKLVKKSTNNFQNINYNLNQSELDSIYKEYSLKKAQINSLRNSLRNEYNLISSQVQKEHFLDSISRIFSKNLTNTIIPFWYGTLWDFNGYTEKPRNGKIACGYFVSTTLRDMGLNLNRFKMAQQTGTSEAQTIACGNSQNIYDISIYNGESIENRLLKFKEGLYFVGLDNHVGYVLIINNKYYFIDSNYIELQVKKERTNTSQTFKSNRYYFARITDNKELMKEWLFNNVVKVILD